MNQQFTYSILQYKHSLALGESVNVGLVFSFATEDKIYFVPGDTKRLKCLYPDFDPFIFSQLTKAIQKRISEKPNANSLFAELFNQPLRDYIKSDLLIEDSSAFQFSEVFFAVNAFENSKKAIDEFSKLLLPKSE